MKYIATREGVEVLNGRGQKVYVYVCVLCFACAVLCCALLRSSLILCVLTSYLTAFSPRPLVCSYASLCLLACRARVRH